MYNIDKTSLDDKEWCKHEFESEIKNIYDIIIPNGMNCIHEYEVNKIAKCNLLHDILTPSKCKKYLNSHYSPILHVCMNTQKGGAKFNNS